MYFDDLCKAIDKLIADGATGDAILDALATVSDDESAPTKVALSRYAEVWNCFHGHA